MLTEQTLSELGEPNLFENLSGRALKASAFERVIGNDRGV